MWPEGLYAVAKITKFVYDEWVRKVCLNILISFSFLIIFLFLATPSYACTISANPSSFPPDYNGDVTITTTDCNFQTSVRYVIFAHPQSVALGGSLNYFTTDRKNPQNSQTLIANLNLFQGAIGKTNPGVWILEVCSKASNLSDCANQSNIVSKTSIMVSAAATPTPTQPPANLPKIDPLAQSKCSFQIGEEVILIATRLQPDTNYRWWWKSDGFFADHKFIGRSDASGSNLTITVPREETNRAEKRQICVDMEGQERTGENCIALSFTTNPPEGDTSCDQTKNASLSSDEQIPAVPPPCKEFDESTKKCLSVDTALGIISTDPASFVKSVFSIVLGLAGGIALILIIIAGYKFMVSRGNPEAVKGATEQLISAVIGLLFIIFSFVILQIVGVDILKIPGFE